MGQEKSAKINFSSAKRDEDFFFSSAKRGDFFQAGRKINIF